MCSSCTAWRSDSRFMVNFSCALVTGAPRVLEPLELTELGLLLAVGILVLPGLVGEVTCLLGGGGGGDVEGGAPARGSPTVCIRS